MLHKKLAKLEFDLVEAFHLPPHPAFDPKLTRRLEKRFDYINNLLSAEVASTPEKSDQHDEIAEKLTGLEAAFRCWSQYRNYANNMYHDDPVPLIDGGEGPELTADHFAGGKKGRNWGGLGKLCGAFGSGVILGAVFCCIAAVDLASFCLLRYRHVYFIPPT